MDKFAPVTPSWNGVTADANLCRGLKEFFIRDHKLNQVMGGNIYDYFRDCNQIRELPAMSIYLLKSTANSQSYLESGVCRLDITIPISLQFGDKFLVGQQLINILNLRLKTSDILEKVTPYCPGIVRLGFSYEVNYAALRKEKSQDAYVLEYNIDYDVDMVKYWDYVLDHGYSVQDPSEYIYPIVTEYDLNINHEEPE